MDSGERRSIPRSPAIFFVSVFALSIPFWMIGNMGDRVSAPLPMNLPLSSLMTFCPLFVALIISHAVGGPREVMRLLRGTLSVRGITPARWYAPIMLSMPVMMALSYWFLRIHGTPIPQPRIQLLAIVPLFLTFVVTAIGEEVGWMGYAIDPMLDRWGALGASLVLGTVWAVWHAIPYVQLHHTMAWIAWQTLFTIASRVLIVWLYMMTGRSVLAAVLFHAMSNVSVALFPIDGSHYDPAVTATIATVAAVAVTFLWGAKTLAQFRYPSYRFS